MYVNFHNAFFFLYPFIFHKHRYNVSRISDSLNANVSRLSTQQKTTERAEKETEMLKHADRQDRYKERDHTSKRVKKFLK